MPRAVKVHKYEDFYQLTKNFKSFYYSGAILGAGDIYEEFFTDIICDSLEDETVKLKLFNSFIEKIKAENKDFEKLDIDTQLYARTDLKLSFISFIVGPKHYIAIVPSLFKIVEKVEQLLVKFIQENDFKTFSYEENKKHIPEREFARIYNPRNPDPNYMFFLKEGEEPYCKLD